MKKKKLKKLLFHKTFVRVMSKTKTKFFALNVSLFVSSSGATDLFTYYLLLITYIYVDIFIVVLNKSALCFYLFNDKYAKLLLYL